MPTSPHNSPGIYDDLCTGCRLATNAEATVLIIIKGVAGSGCSVQVRQGADLNLPALLRELATNIEATNQGPATQSFPA